MSAAQADRYALGRTPEEYERLRAQARVWEAATSRLFDADVTAAAPIPAAPFELVYAAPSGPTSELATISPRT